MIKLEHKIIKNREIKFRVWDKLNQTWVKTPFIGGHPLFMLNLKFELGYIDDAWDGQPSPEYIIQQFTGLYDTNKKEIFEGDIISQLHHNEQKLLTLENKNYEVKYERMIDSHGFICCGFYADVFHIRKGCEVVGNIFENPELLNKND